MTPVDTPTLSSPPTEAAPCPLCSARAGWFADENDCQLHRCRDCQLVFVHPAPNPEELRIQYEVRTKHGTSEDYYRRYMTQEPGLRQHAKGLLRWLGAPPPEGRLLEIGCGAGFFLAEAKRFGWRAEGIEPNRIFAEHAREHYAVEVHEGRLEDVEIGVGEYDAVVMLDLMSHLHDPIGALRRIARSLVPGGALLIQGGLRGEARSKPEDEDWETPFHLFHYGRSSFARILASAGFEILETKQEAKVVLPPSLRNPKLRWLKELARPALPLLKKFYARPKNAEGSEDWTYYLRARRL